jgi:hypothetical protein
MKASEAAARIESFSVEYFEEKKEAYNYIILPRFFITLSLSLSLHIASFIHLPFLFSSSCFSFFSRQGLL